MLSARKYCCKGSAVKTAKQGVFLPLLMSSFKIC